MKSGIHSIIISIFLIFSCTTVMAQEDSEYRMEIGGGVGMMTYEGDFNGSVMSGSNTSPSLMLILRRVINPYCALRFGIGYGKLKGASKDVQTYYPDFNTGLSTESARKDYEFNNNLIDFAATYEYNFFPYGTGHDYRGAQRFTPFISLGIGFTYVNCKDGTVDFADAGSIPSGGLVGAPEMSGSKGVFTANLPLAFGVKYKLTERLNLAAEWAFHFTLSDKLDGVKDPYRIKSNGMFKNTDCYSNVQISLTYSFWEKCSTCNKD